jgi:hypothetical protein
MNHPPHADPSASTPLTQNLTDFLSSNVNQLQAILQLATLLNPATVAGNPLLSQQQQSPQALFGTQSIAQTAPNLLSLLGIPQNTAGGSSLLNGSSAVGTFANDEELLVAALRESGSKGLTYRQALDNLHGVR